MKYPSAEDFGLQAADASLISLLASSRNQDTKKNFDDMAIAYHAATFLAAGQDTTAATITMTLFYLAKYPDLQARAAQECAKLDV